MSGLKRLIDLKAAGYVAADVLQLVTAKPQVRE